MNLQTKISLPPQDPKISYNAKVVLLGSCFSDNIGQKFNYYKFNHLINPFGILFHPKAIETLLWMAVQSEKYTESDLFYHNGQWHCFDAHSSLSSSDKNELLTNLNQALLLTKESIKSASHIFITLGTAWTYRLKSLDLIVANCHKIPQREFGKELLPVDEILQCLQHCIHLIRSINSSIKIVFTVSPVRHIKDGFVENTRSKSHLIAAIHQVLESGNNLSYFPSYEIMMDELRDYRFYNEDMIHPSEIAIQYIWEAFCRVWIDEDTKKMMDRIQEIQKGLAHRPFNPKSEQHKIFLEKLEVKKKKLQDQYPFISF